MGCFAAPNTMTKYLLAAGDGVTRVSGPNPTVRGGYRTYRSLVTFFTNKIAPYAKLSRKYDVLRSISIFLVCLPVAIEITARVGTAASSLFLKGLNIPRSVVF